MNDLNFADILLIFLVCLLIYGLLYWTKRVNKKKSSPTTETEEEKTVAASDKPVENTGKQES